jgi:hypothetical protein
MKQLKLYLDKITSISSSDWNFFISKLHRRIITIEIFWVFSINGRTIIVQVLKRKTLITCLQSS